MKTVDLKFVSKLFLSSVIFEIILYYLIEVLWAQLIVYRIENALITNSWDIVIEIEIAGILFAIAISFIIQLFASEKIVFKDQLLCLSFGTLFNLSLISAIAYSVLYVQFGTVLTPWEQLANFAIYSFENPVLLWFVLMVMNSFCYSVMLLIRNASIEWRMK